LAPPPLQGFRRYYESVRLRAHATVLNPSRFRPLETLPLAPLSGRQFRGTLSPVPHESSIDWAHVACMPDTTWPIDGHPPGLSRSFSNTPVLMSTNPFRHFHGVRLPAPYLTHQVRLFPHRSPRQASTNAACGRFETTPRRAIPGGLPPSFVQFRLEKLTYKPLSATGHNGD
jgi:hypothetical protein